MPTKLDSSKDMLLWQYKTILSELQQIELHENGDCPCILSDLNPPEKCLGKHSLNVFSLCSETAQMDSANATMLLGIAEEANEYHEKFREFICHRGELPDLREWARLSRKKIEPLYYACSVKSGKPKLHDIVVVGQPLGALPIARLAEAPQVKIAGVCVNNGCSFKVKATDIVQASTSTIAELPELIQDVSDSLRATKKPSRKSTATGPTGSHASKCSPRQKLVYCSHQGGRVDKWIGTQSQLLQPHSQSRLVSERQL